MVKGEISTPELRGRLGFLYTAMICSGLLVISLLGMVLDWRWMSAFTVASPIILLTAMFVASESPFFLLTKGISFLKKSFKLIIFKLYHSF